MKTSSPTKSGQNSAPSSEPRGGGLRPAAAKPLAHRYERRKIREQLRRLDWALNVADEIFS